MLADVLTEMNTLSNGAILGGMAIGILAVSVAKCVSRYRKRQRQSRMLGAQLRDISELAVEEMRCSLVHSTKEFRQLFAMETPFVRERLIFVVDAVLKIGFDFDEIHVKVDEWHKKIVLHIPEMKILSNAILYDSFRVLDEKTGAKRRAECVINSLDELIKEAEGNAHKWGAFDRAKTSARDRLTILVAKFFDLTYYDVQFIFADDSYTDIEKTNDNNVCA